MADKLTMEQFGQRIKAAHPEYSDMADADVGQKVLAKYPEYGDMVAATPTMPPGDYPAAVGQPGADSAAGTPGNAQIGSNAQPQDFLTAAINSLRSQKSAQPVQPKEDTLTGGSAVQQYLTGLALKGLPKTAAGIFSLVPGLQNDPGLNAMKEYATPATSAENAGQLTEQVAEMAAPAAVAGKVAKAVPVAERVIQGRNVLGQFMTATRNPVVQDVIRRALVRGATQSALSGALNKAQGGTFEAGAGAGAAGSALAETAPVAGKALEKLASSPTGQAIQKVLPFGGVAAVASGHVPAHILSAGAGGLAIGALLKTPAGRQIVMQALRSGLSMAQPLFR